MIKYFLISIAVLAFLAGCSSVSVTNDYDPSVDFSKYTSFSLYKGTIEGSELESAPLVKKRVMEAITNEMIKKIIKATIK